VSETRHAHEGKKRELKFKKTIEKNCVEEIIARTWIIFFFKTSRLFRAGSKGLGDIHG
jgi:hypothetical protein